MDELGDAAAITVWKQTILDASTGPKGVRQAAQKLVLDRCYPPRRGRRFKLEIPEGVNTADISAISEHILKAVLAGDLSPEEAGCYAAVVEAHRKTLEMHDHELRLAALEGALLCGDEPDRRIADSRH